MSSQNPDTRDLDIVVFGATGFTGGLTAAYLARNAPAGLRLGLAGRNPGKLEAVRERLGREGIELITADVSDPASLATLAERTRVVVTTVGPYLEYGEALVKACAEAGTDYVDLTGEPEFVDRMYLAYDGVARGTGARLVHACGFDSIPHDLGVLFAVSALGADGPVAARGVVRSNGSMSGGTFHSALTQFSRARSLARTSKERIAAEKAAQRASGAVLGKASSASPAPTRDRELGYWLLPLPTIDPQIVLRSARALPDVYGSDFTYGHYAGTKTLRYAVGGAAGVAGLMVAAQIPPLRRWLGAKVPQGTGPSEGRRAKSWFTVDVRAEGDGRVVDARVSGPDPGYDGTAIMLAESALCLALDDLPPLAGQLTTAVAMGRPLIDRLQPAGIRFELLP
ncbi:MAG: saccharopine dehydrogenase NADP-binding domain-containing protein [Nocardioides sp.]|uniref:saccharopine dehydrogenase family protein n=1 Tax=Nocardioides sp. TaxID=35761 RepID=UPI0039E704E2